MNFAAKRVGQKPPEDGKAGIDVNNESEFRRSAGMDSANILWRMILSSFVFTVFHTNLYSQDTIVWKPGIKLQWSDFIGKRPPDEGYGAVSFTSMEFHVHFDGNKLFFSVAAIFNKKKSWVRLRLSSGLEHEQGHFDISEIFARRLRQAIANYKLQTSNFELDLSLIFDKIEKERSAMQDLYDKETDFSRDKNMQQLWNKKIEMELKALNGGVEVF